MIEWNQFGDRDLIAAYGGLIEELRRRELIRTKNIVGDLGESLAIAHYNATEGLPDLDRAPANTTDYDATDVRRGTRYSIKTTTGRRTSAFHLPESHDDSVAAFEIAMVVVLDGDYGVRLIQEYTWSEFLSVRQWSKRQRAWFIDLSKGVLKQGRVVLTVPVAAMAELEQACEP